MPPVFCIHQLHANTVLRIFFSFMQQMGVTLCRTHLDKERKKFTIYEKKHSLSDIVTVFKDDEATPCHISEAGEKFLVTLYGGNMDTDTLDDLHYRIFSNSMVKYKFHLPRLPPTQDAAQQHSFRTYIQVQMWLGFKKLPSVWGWTLIKQGLI